MKVTMINFTPDALDTLLFTRSTRLTMSPEGFLAVQAWPEGKKREELEKMRNTIQSSWEFVDYIFAIQDVTRAFTHQLVRHRVGTSFAQQSQRSVDMENFTFETGPSIRRDPVDHLAYEEGMLAIKRAYHKLTEAGVAIQDARGILPTNIHTNIVFKANLRTLHEMGLKRLCVKTQGEFQDVFRLICEAVFKVHPWAKDFIKVHCAWNGTCVFPDFPVEDCPVKPHVYNPKTPGKAYSGDNPASLGTIQALWENYLGEAQTKIA